MTTSGPVAAGRYGVTLYQYPATGSFYADRSAIIGNTSSAVGQIGTNIDGLLTPVAPRHYRTRPVLLDGADYIRTEYGANRIVVPVVVYADSRHEALVEWRRVIAAFEPRYNRAAIEVTDPNTTGQESRWLTELILDDVSDVLLEHDAKDIYVGRMGFSTIGDPFWTPEPIANEETETQVMAATETPQAFVTSNPGTHGAWPMVSVSGLHTDAAVSLTLASTGETVQITDVGTGSTGIDFDRRRRSRADDTRVSVASVYFRIPPGNDQVNVFVTEAVTGASTVTLSYLPRYATI